MDQDDQQNVSAFAAYGLNTSPPPRPAAPARKITAAAATGRRKQAAASKKSADDVSFRQLSHDEMIERLISKKKQELKRKSDGGGSGKKAAKRNKKAAAAVAGQAAAQASSQSAPVSRNTSGISPPSAAASTSVPGSSKKVSPSASPDVDHHQPHPQHSQHHPTHHHVKPTIKIYPKYPERISFYLSKRNTKRNQPKKAAANGQANGATAGSPKPIDQLRVTADDDDAATAQPPALPSPTESTESSESVATALNGNGTVIDFTNLVQSTPICGPPASASAKKAGRKSTQNASRAGVSVKPEPVTPIRQAERTLRAIAADDGCALPAVGSIETGRDLLAWVIHPTSVDEFMANAWEKTPLLLDRKCPAYYGQLLSTESFDRMLREQRVEFTKNLDVTSYVDGVRKTHNPEGRALPPTVWDFYRQGCSIRLLNPQTFLPVVHSMNATLQEYFQCMTGANVYLTPANSQGFAPHYDDIEAFVLQVEGKKHWKVYAPRSAAETLPRDSSPNFSQSEIGAPILDVILEAGDLLYFPRGFIHQATTVPGHHSMHITLSAYQKNSYADLLEQLLPAMLQSTIAEAPLLRRGLPLHLWQCMGLVHSDEEDTAPATLQRRRDIIAQLRACLDLTMKSLEEQCDDAVDRLALRFQHDALPPALTGAERARTVHGSVGRLRAGAIERAMPGRRTPLRLVRANILRLVRHSAEEFRIYYHAENSREYHELEQTYVEIGAEDAPAVEYLVKAYPVFSAPGDWPIEDDEQAVAVAQDLWERGLLVTQDVLQ